MKIQEKLYAASEVHGATTQTSFRVHHSRIMFDVLSSRIYTDKVAAIIREIVSNAIDAGGKAWVTLPNVGSPSFKVRDNGPGISPENINDIYTVYFASTKRDDNTNIGGFGLGAKTPLAYTDSFSVRSVHQGVLSLYVVNRTEDGVPVLNLMHREDTTEENGLEVSVPVPEGDFGEWANKTRYLCAWQEDRVVLEGTTEQIEKPYIYRDEKFAYSTGKDCCGIVIGGWFYKVPTTYDRTNFVQYLNVGDVDLAVSREALEQTPKTKEYLAKLVDIFDEEYIPWVGARLIEYVDAAPTIVERYIRREKVLKWVRTTDKFVYEHKLPVEWNVYTKNYRSKYNVSTIETLYEYIRHQHPVWVNDVKFKNRKENPWGSFYLVDNSPETLAFIKEVGVPIAGLLSERPDKERTARESRKEKITVYKDLGHYGRIGSADYVATADSFPVDQKYVIVENRQPTGLARALARTIPGGNVIGVAKSSLSHIPKTWVHVTEEWALAKVQRYVTDEVLQYIEAFENDADGYGVLRGVGLVDAEVAKVKGSAWGKFVTDIDGHLPILSDEFQRRGLKPIRKKLSVVQSKLYNLLTHHKGGLLNDEFKKVIEVIQSNLG